MNENTPTLIPVAELQEILRQHISDTRRYHFFDREGRLAWSNREGHAIYNWYLYDNDGQPLEVGECFVNAGLNAHIVTVYQCTTGEAAEFIMKKLSSTCLLRRIPEPITEVAPAPAICETTTQFLTLPVLDTPAIEQKTFPQPATSETGAHFKDSLTAHITSTSLFEAPCIHAPAEANNQATTGTAHSAVTIQYKEITQSADAVLSGIALTAGAPGYDSSFANQLLADIFSMPGQFIRHACKQQYTPQRESYLSAAYYLSDYRFNLNGLYTNPEDLIKETTLHISHPILFRGIISAPADVHARHACTTPCHFEDST